MEDLNENNTERQILEIRDQIAAMGANDYEIPAINEIMALFKKGELPPEKALEEAHAIKDRKSTPY